MAGRPRKTTGTSITRAGRRHKHSGRRHKRQGRVAKRPGRSHKQPGRIAKPAHGKHLTDFELMILLAILRVDEDAYGVPIAREIEETGRKVVVIGAIYTALDRLEHNGLVTSSMGDSTPERSGAQVLAEGPIQFVM